MMSASFHRLAVLFALLALAAAAPAQPRPVEIKDVRVGLPSGDGYRCRLGAWAPVRVDIAVGDKDVPADELELVTETADSDDVQNQFFLDVPALDAKKTHAVLTYVRPSNRTGKLTVSLRKKGGPTVQSFPHTPGFGELLAPGDVFYLTAGARLPGLARALSPQQQPNEEADREAIEQRVATVTSAAQVPTRWYGLQGVDVLVLATGNKELVSGLLDRSRPGQRHTPAAALGEWVRRGGRLVVGVGANHQAAFELLRRMGLGELFTYEKLEEPRDLPGIGAWTGAHRDPFPGGRRVQVVRARAAEGAAVLARDGDWPLVAVAPAGLGRVMFVAFDLDSAALAEWNAAQQFWTAVNRDMGPRLPGQVRNPEGRELGGALQRTLEHFDEVPVISFGWVAFFILLYILIVGPLDYFFLKKVVKRLELTWITFPVIVLVISVAAYYTAYALKGHDLRINKVDVVDVDLHRHEVHGTTWFALFSPRVQNYTVGIEPAPGWGGPGSGVLVSSLSPADQSPGGVDRPGSQSLFRRPYSYAPEGAGLRGVPVPVWASRSFTASWQARFKEGELFAASDFGISRDGQRLIGQLHNHLPVTLTEVTLLYRGRPYPVPDLAPGEAFRIDALNVQTSGTANMGEWLGKSFGHSAPGQTGPDRSRAPTDVPAVPDLMKTILFHSHGGGKYSNMGNSLLRPLDQGWRLEGVGAPNRVSPSEAILVARATHPPEAESASRAGVSPTRLWLGALPGEGERPELKGFLGQDTYIRIYLPVGPVD